MRKNGYEYALVEPPMSEESALRAAKKFAKISEVKRAVSRHYALPPGALEATSRQREWAHPRQIAIYLCRVHTEASYPMIGMYFGSRHHTTAMFAYRKVASFVQRDEIWASEMKTIATKIAQEIDARPPIPRWSASPEPLDEDMVVAN
jgi:chromosomal replication initiation ATPase DnaA